MATESGETILVRYGRRFIDAVPEPFGVAERATDSLVWLRQTRTDLATLIARADFITDAHNPEFIDIGLNEAATRAIATARKAASQAGWDLSAVEPRPLPEPNPAAERYANRAARYLADFISAEGLRAAGEAARPALEICAELEALDLPNHLADLIPTERLRDAVRWENPNTALAAEHWAHLLAAETAKSAEGLRATVAPWVEGLPAACRALQTVLTQPAPAAAEG